MGRKMEAYGFTVFNYDLVFVYNSEEAMQRAVEANRGSMKVIVGASEATRESFPGVYIAGLKFRDKEENL